MKKSVASVVEAESTDCRRFTILNYRREAVRRKHLWSHVKSLCYFVRFPQAKPAMTRTRSQYFKE